MHNMHGVVVTATFQREADRAKLSEDEVQHIIAVIAANPAAGDLMPGTGGLRKLRFARHGGGKSGGYRTIHYYAGDDIPVFLITIINKREKENVTRTEQNEIAKQLPLLVSDYRMGLKRKSRSH